MGFFQFLTDHFFHALPNLILAVFAILIVAERANALFNRYTLKDENRFLKSISDSIVNQGPEEARKACAKEVQVPLVQVVEEALKRANLPEEMIRDGLQIQIGRFAKLIQKRTGFLATIANVATLVGLFGTIIGLIDSFNAVAEADPTQKAAMLTAGISTAMNATMLGLGIAIPCMVAYSFLTNRANRVVGDLEDASLVVVDALRSRYVGSIEGKGRQSA